MKKNMMNGMKGGKMTRCPLGGDETDCKNCVYYPDYEYDESLDDCVRREEDGD